MESASFSLSFSTRDYCNGLSLRTATPYTAVTKTWPGELLTLSGRDGRPICLLNILQ